MNFKSKLLALVLAVTLLVGALPMTASAATDITAQITDANLLQAVRDRLGKAAGDPVTDEDMASIIDLSAFERGITSLDGLQYATSLQELFVNNNAISDLSPLSGLTSLKLLNLWDNDITDIAPLSGLAGLNNLDLSANSISDLSPLSGMTSLEMLSLYENSITDISALSGLTALSDLQLDSNPGITDYSPLAGLSSLHSLSLAHNGITSVSSLSSLTGLTQLILEGNQISDISPLADMTGMQWLDLGANAIQDISALTNMPDLFELRLFTNQISDISPLSGLTSLTLLELHDNLIRNVSPLSGLTNLNYLYIYQNQIADISSLSGLNDLLDFYFSENQIRSIGAVTNMTSLQILNASKNNISDIRPINALIGVAPLNTVYLDQNYLNTTAGSATMTTLTSLLAACPGTTWANQKNLSSTPFTAQVTAHTSTSFSLGWEDLPDTIYELIRTSEGTVQTLIAQTDNSMVTSYMDTGLVPNTSYTYYVRAYFWRGDGILRAVASKNLVDIVTDVDPSMTDPVIIVHPASKALAYGNATTFTVTASSPNGGTLSYQWQKSTDSGTSWDDIASATSASYTTGTLGAADNGTQYRCAVTNTKDSTVKILNSNAATLTMTANSPESDFVFISATGTITGYNGPGGSVRIPQTIGGVPVTAIGASAFDSKTSMTSLVIPEGVTSIGSNAFMACANLSSIVLPNTLLTIGASAFSYITSTGFTQITIPAGVTSIGSGAFYSADYLTRVKFLGAPPSVGGTDPDLFHTFRTEDRGLKITYLSDNTAFAAAVSGGKWHGYDAIPLISVTYDANGATGGDAPTDTALYEPGQNAPVADNTGSLTNTDLVFAGWNTAADGSGTHYAAGALLPIDGSGNVTLYTQWGVIPVITTAALADGVTGTAYSQTLTADGTTPITWSVSAGSLPDGLSLDADTGLISGTPTTAGAHDFTVQADNYAGNATQPLSITVSAPPSITTSSLPDGVFGESYNQTLAASGTAPITWTVSLGSLPGGLSLDADTGVISGAPTAFGTYGFTVQANNSVGDDTQALSITINVLPSIVTAFLPNGTTGVVYSQVLQATGTEPFTWTVCAGSLPDGLSLINGLIFGTPTTDGIYDFTVQAQNSAGTDTQAFSVTIFAPPSITTSSLPHGAVGVPYSQALTADGTAPINWYIDPLSDNLPDGLVLSPSGLISGTPTTAGTYNNIILWAYNGGGEDTTTLSITINVLPSITTSSLPNGTVGAPYSQTLAASGSTPITWSVSAGSLPGGLSLDTDTGVISGAPEAGGTFDFTVQATSSAGNDTQALSITVDAPPAITTGSLPDGALGVPYSQTLAADGAAPITWTLDSGDLPDGLDLSTAGVISGTPTAGGTYDFTVKATNSLGDDTQALSIIISTPPSITTAILPDGVVGFTYSQPLMADGAIPITWTISAGSLPDGLSLNTMTGVISGDPEATGTCSFTVQAHNILGNDTQALSITITASPDITTTSLPDGVVGVPYSQALEADGTAPIGWALWYNDVLPDGLLLDTDTGVISGTPTTAGAFNFAAVAYNTTGGDFAQLSITVHPAPTVTSVTVSPAAASVLKGGTRAFTAIVGGTNNPGQTVTWTVTGGIAGTTINASGLLTIAENETAATLTVTAASTVDTSKSGTANVTVLSPAPTATPSPKPTPTPAATKYTITAASNNTAQGAVSGGGKFASGTSVTLSASPKSGYRFVRWLEGSKAVSSSAEYTFTVTKARTLKAEFAWISSPRNVQAASAGYDRIKITWSAVPGAKEYQIFRASSKNGTYTRVGVSTSASFICTGLTAGKTYFFRVRARCVAGKTSTYGGYGAIVSATPIPIKPSSFKGSAASFNSILLTWKEVPGTTKYVVYRAASRDGYYQKLAETSSATYTDKGLIHKKTYFYKVRAYCLAGKTKVYGSYTDIISVRPILGTPTNVEAVRTPDDSIKVSWKTVSGASGYDVYRATSRTGKFTLVDSVAGGSKVVYADKDLKKGQTYYYQIQAYKLVGKKKLYGGFSEITLKLK